MLKQKLPIAAAGLLAISFAVLFGDIIARLVHDWSIDENYSHGFFIVPLALYFAWVRRGDLPADTKSGSGWGLIVVIGSIFVLLAGLLGSEFFLTRVSIIGVLAGGVLFLLGWRALRTLAFPLAFLVLMVPLPAIIFNQIAFPLQLLASRVGELTLQAVSIPVLREGNVMTLSHITLEVAEACSGIRSLISLLTLGIVYGYFTDPRTSIRIALAVLTVPIAIAANAFRVAGTGIAAHFIGPAAAEGFLHTFSGWIVFVVGVSMLFLAARILLWLFPAQRVPPTFVPQQTAAERVG